MTDKDALRLVERLATWLRSRSQPDSGISYEGPHYSVENGSRSARVSLGGADATFVMENMHGRGAAALAAALASQAEEIERLTRELQRTKRHHNPALAFILDLAPGTEIVPADVPAETRKKAFNALTYSTRYGITERLGYGHYRRLEAHP